MGKHYAHEHQPRLNEEESVAKILGNLLDVTAQDVTGGYARGTKPACTLILEGQKP